MSTEATHILNGPLDLKLGVFLTIPPSRKRRKTSIDRPLSSILARQDAFLNKTHQKPPGLRRRLIPREIKSERQARVHEEHPPGPH
jgi:hypothetical protein